MIFLFYDLTKPESTFIDFGRWYKKSDRNIVFFDNRDYLSKVFSPAIIKSNPNGAGG